MERRLSSLSSSPNDLQEIQSQVGRMLTRIKMVAPFTVLSTLENLVEVASRHGHKDAAYWKKALEECRGHEGTDGFPDLVKQLFGSAEDKRVSAAIQGWKKSRLLEQSQPGRSVAAGNVEPATAQLVTPPPPPPYPHPYYPPLAYYPYPPNPYRSPRGRGRGSRNPAGQRPGAGLCYVCNEPGHKALECPKRQPQAKA